MGALDCRQLLSPANPENLGDRVLSLTTVGGIHHGSPTADLVWGKLHGAHHNLIERWIVRRLTHVLGALGLSFAGVGDLTTEATARFNATYTDHPGVRYRSVAGDGRAGRRKVARVIVWSWRYIRVKTREPNDGFVTPTSATWGELDTNFWPADHLGEVGHDLDCFGDEPKDFDYKARWVAMVSAILDAEPTP